MERILAGLHKHEGEKLLNGSSLIIACKTGEKTVARARPDLEAWPDLASGCAILPPPRHGDVTWAARSTL
jgi:hypothetical protein